MPQAWEGEGAPSVLGSQPPLPSRPVDRLRAKPLPLPQRGEREKRRALG